VVDHSDNSIPEKPPQSIGEGRRVDGVRSSVRIRPRVRGGSEPLRAPSTLLPSDCPWNRSSIPLYHCGCHSWSGSPSSYIIADARGLPFAGKKPAGGQAEPLQAPEADVPNYSVHHYVSPQRFNPTTKAHRLLPPPLGVESLEPPSPVAQAPPKAEAHSDRREASSLLEPKLAQCTHTNKGEKEKGKKQKEKRGSSPNFIVPCGGWLREKCGHGNVRWVLLKCHLWTCEYCAPGKFMELQERLQGAYSVSEDKGWTLKFVTLTWAEDVTKKQVRLHLAHLVQAIRRKYGYCEYAKVPEWTKNHRIHLHLAMIMPYIPQKALSNMWRKYAGAPNVWITAVQDPKRLKNELSKYLAKGPAGKVTYSRQFPEAMPWVTVKPGVCNSCNQEHTFIFVTHAEAEKHFPLEVLGRDSPGLPVRPTGGVTSCGCWDS